jgi:hypothetical protein
MRYADMVIKLEHDWPTEDQPAKPDAVLVFEPQVNGCEKWLEHTNVAKTPDRIDGVSALRFLAAARPLPKKMVPASFSIRGYDYNYIRGYRHKKQWPADLPQVMPDFYLLRNNTFIVSSAAREVLDAIVPGAIEYIEVKIDIPPNLTRALAYYFINVLPHAQLIDWARVKPSQMAGYMNRQLSRNSANVPFKPRRPNDPLIWHEMDADPEHQFDQACVLMRGSLLNTLIEHFPLQLRSRMMQISSDD